MKLKKIFISLVFLKMAFLMQTVHATPIKLPHQMYYDNKPIDAGCLVELVNGIPSGKIKNNSINLANCGEKSKKPQFKIVEDLPENFPPGFIGYRRKVKFLDLDNTFEIHGGYKYLGKIEDYFIFWLQHVDGGSGNFSHIIALQRHNDELELAKEFTSGDRCFGGITNAVVKNNVLSWANNITPYELLDLSNANLNTSTYDELWGCAVCCIGTAQYENNQLKYIVLAKDNLFSNLSSPQNKQETCFKKIYKKFISKNCGKLGINNLKDFAAQFAKCESLN